MSSKQVDYSRGTSRAGLQYSAPKALFSIELLGVGNSVEVTVSEPFLEGDPNATFTLKAISGTFADQDYRFVVDGETRLLTTIRSDSDGKAGDILVSAAESLGGVYGMYRSEQVRGYGEEPRLLYHRIIDPMMQPGCGFGQPCRFEALTDDLAAAASEYLRCSVSPMDRENRLCPALRSGADLFEIELTPLFEALGGTNLSKSARTCRDSVCYRVPVPYEMRLKVAGVTDVSQIVRLPNEGPLFGLSLPAGLFADAESTVSLTNGMPTEVATKKRERGGGRCRGTPAGG